MRTMSYMSHPLTQLNGELVTLHNGWCNHYGKQLDVIQNGGQTHAYIEIPHLEPHLRYSCTRAPGDMFQKSSDESRVGSDLLS